MTGLSLTDAFLDAFPAIIALLGIGIITGLDYGAHKTERKPKVSLFKRMFGRGDDSAETPPAVPGALAEDEVLEQDFAAEAADHVLATDSYPDETDSAGPLALGQKRSWWTPLRDGLSRSSGSIGESLAAIFAKRKLDAGMLEELEDVLIRADLGVATAARISKAIGAGRYDKGVGVDEVRGILAAEIERVLTPYARPLEIDPGKKPFVILVVGVNGSGKTTTIGKLAAQFKADDMSVVLVAGDTFRAAAIEQLRILGERSHRRRWLSMR